MIHPVKMISDHSNDLDVNTSFFFEMNSTMVIEKNMQNDPQT